MKRAVSFMLLFACGSSEPPPRTQVTVAQPTASAAPVEDAGVASMWGSSDLGDGVGGGGTGIGLGSIGDAGHLGEGQGFGSGHGHLGGSHSSPGSRIDPAAVQRVVRANMVQTKACYERALAKAPNLSGRVNTRFVIEPSGDVSSATSTDDTTMPNADVVRCVVAVFKSMKFPQPEGGSVTIVYPLIFSAAD
jgi:hypothetical protein